MAKESNISGKWKQAGIPHKGWTCVDIDELEEPDHLCEMCEQRYVRYVHVMEHHKYPTLLRVGCVCAGHMEENHRGAKARESKFKSGKKRRGKWVKAGWLHSARGNEYKNTRDGFNVTVFLNKSGWGVRVKRQDNTGPQHTKQGFQTSDEAKSAAFDLILKLKLGFDTA